MFQAFILLKSTCLSYKNRKLPSNAHSYEKKKKKNDANGRIVEYVSFLNILERKIPQNFLAMVSIMDIVPNNKNTPSNWAVSQFKRWWTFYMDFENHLECH